MTANRKYRSAAALRASFVTIVATVVIACGAPVSSPSGPSPALPTTGPSPTIAPSADAGSPAITTSPTGFEFDVESVALYYASRGYACTDPQPSQVAADHTFRSCSLVDAAGRTLVVGLVTNALGELANAYASVEAAPSEDFLEPLDALEPLAGFLGAMLGEARGEDILPWLAGHLGDAYAETAVGPLRVATYTPSATDHSTLYVELGTPDYLTSPTPAAT